MMLDSIEKPNARLSARRPQTHLMLTLLLGEPVPAPRVMRQLLRAMEASDDPASTFLAFPLPFPPKGVSIEHFQGDGPLIGGDRLNRARLITERS